MSKNVYKVGECMYVHETGADLNVVDFEPIKYPGFTTKGDYVLIYDYINSSTDMSKISETRNHFKGEKILISDVRNADGEVIGDGSKSAVRDYLSNLM